jgi:hypothetical protein
LGAAAEAIVTVIARLDRAIQHAVAAVLITNASGILDHPLSRTMTTEFLNG